MRLSPPIRWSQVPVGAVVLCHDGVPRTVLANDWYPGHRDGRSILIEGMPTPLVTVRTITVQLVLLDDADAVATLAAAGLNPEPIEENPRP